jgi:hypothetical protein
MGIKSLDLQITDLDTLQPRVFITRSVSASSKTKTKSGSEFRSSLTWPVTEIRLGTVDTNATLRVSSINGIEIVNDGSLMLDALFAGLKVNTPTKEFAKIILSRLAGIVGGDGRGAWVVVTRLNEKNEAQEECELHYEK